MNGILITIEGIEGSGKTTQAIKLESYLNAIGYPVLRTFEPGATQVGKKLREILLNKSDVKLHPVTELFLFSADRAQHISEVIIPAMNQGKIVICDRFIDSTTAYQGGGRNLKIDQIQEIHKIATLGITPTRTYLLDLPPEIGLSRIFKERHQLDRLESECIDFHINIRKAFLKIAESASNRFLIIDATLPEDSIFEIIKNDITKIIDEHYLRKK